MPQQLRFYRSRKTGDGYALSFQLRVYTQEEKTKRDDKFTNVNLFLEAAKQNGFDENENAKFFWQDPSKVTMKLQSIDVGKILSVLNGDSAEIQLFHKTEKGTTIWKFSRTDKGFTGQLSRKFNDDVKPTSYPTALDFGDGAVLKVLLERYILLDYDWVI